MDRTAILTLDVEEDYEGIDGIFDGGNQGLSDRLPVLIPRWLRLLDQHDATATFFVLGREVERHPDLIRAILNEGHEIGSHGYRHVSYRSLSRSEIRRDVRRARRVLSVECGLDPEGFRAPQFSLSPDDMAWFSGVLQEEGFRYDSSLVGPGHPGFGDSSVDNQPHRYGNILEIPVPSQNLFGWPFLVGGSVFFRLLPYRLTRMLMHRYTRDSGNTPVLYFHPWELEPGRWSLWLKASLRAKFAHFWGRWGFHRKLRRLLQDYRLITVRDYLSRETDEIRGS